MPVTMPESHCLDDPSVESYCIPGAKVFDRYFECPLDYNDPANTATIKVFVRHLVPISQVSQMKALPFFLYLQGGPGFEAATLPMEVSSGWMKLAFDKGYQILLLDQRGTGLSTPVSTQSLKRLGSDERIADYLTHFRADSIVRDCETIRKLLTAGRSPDEESRITLLGQSFGGFCIVAYLSLFPESIHRAYITGGVPPLVDSPDPVYRALYPRVLKKNKIYYSKFPADVDRVRQIHRYLSLNKVALPNGGNLSPRRFLQLGLLFGGSGGYDTVHQVVAYAARDLDELGALSYRTLYQIQALQSWDTNIIYAILHEVIYCQHNQSSNWSAERIRAEEHFAKDFEWRLEHLDPSKPIHFTGEMIYPFMFDDYVELAPLKGAANLIAEYTGWGQLYDEQVLRNINVPVAGVSYFEDMYVDISLSVETANEINNFQQWVTNEYAHNGLRVDGERVLRYLMRLADGDAGFNR